MIKRTGAGKALVVIGVNYAGELPRIAKAARDGKWSADQTRAEVDRRILVLARQGIEADERGVAPITDEMEAAEVQRVREKFAAMRASKPVTDPEVAQDILAEIERQDAAEAARKAAAEAPPLERVESLPEGLALPSETSENAVR